MGQFQSVSKWHKINYNMGAMQSQNYIVSCCRVTAKQVASRS